MILHLSPDYIRRMLKRGENRAQENERPTVKGEKMKDDREITILFLTS